MSSKKNHMARSHRSEHLKRSALGNMARRAYIRDSGRTSPGTPLIYRLRAMRQKILANKAEKAEEAGKEI